VFINYVITISILLFLSMQVLASGDSTNYGIEGSGYIILNGTYMRIGDNPELDYLFKDENQRLAALLQDCHSVELNNEHVLVSNLSRSSANNGKSVSVLGCISLKFFELRDNDLYDIDISKRTPTLLVILREDSPLNFEEYEGSKVVVKGTYTYVNGRHHGGYILVNSLEEFVESLEEPAEK